MMHIFIWYKFDMLHIANFLNKNGQKISWFNFWKILHPLHCGKEKYEKAVSWKGRMDVAMISRPHAAGFNERRALWGSIVKLILGSVSLVDDPGGHSTSGGLKALEVWRTTTPL
jgi:hypothetical protein